HALELLGEVVRLQRRGDDSFELRRSAQGLRDGYEPARPRAALERRPGRRKTFAVLEVRLEVRPVEEGEIGRGRVVGIVDEPAVRPDDEQGSRERHVLQTVSQELLKSRIVLCGPRLKLMRIGDGGEREIERLERACRELLDDCCQRSGILQASPQRLLSAGKHEPEDDSDCCNPRNPEASKLWASPGAQHKTRDAFVESAVAPGADDGCPRGPSGPGSSRRRRDRYCSRRSRAAQLGMPRSVSPDFFYASHSLGERIWMYAIRRPPHGDAGTAPRTPDRSHPARSEGPSRFAALLRSDLRGPRYSDRRQRRRLLLGGRALRLDCGQ